MSNQLRLDPLTGRWVAVSIGRAERPLAFSPRDQAIEEDLGRPCPFCPGNEGTSVPALETYGPTGSWLVRVLPNLYPAFEGDAPFILRNKGPVFTEASAGGIHEVLVLSPDHQAAWSKLDDDQCSLVMAAVRDRVDEHSCTPVLRYSQVIVNSGREAGASLEHPHAQLLGVSFVPRELADEQAGFSRFKGGCLLCATADAEEGAGHRLVTSDEISVVVCPFWSGVPYEMLVVPRQHCAHLHRSAPEVLAGVGKAIRNALASLESLLGDVAYNIVFHSAPYRIHEPFHWHVHILPKLTTRAGFELGTGVPINIVAPEQAAAELHVEVPLHHVA
ncbi:MAG: galactose-1-phosphate uridylyltransferase [Acidimicrobiales bacterium]